MGSSHTPVSSDSQKKKAVPPIRLSEEQREQLREAFDVFDKDAAGTINARAIKVVIQALGYEPNKEETKRILAAIDKDATGIIDFTGFVTMMAFKMAERDPDREIMKSFRLFDDRGTGVITFDDLKRAAEDLDENFTDEKIKEMIDKTGIKGEVTKRQYFRLMKNAVVYPVEYYSVDLSAMQAK